MGLSTHQVGGRLVSLAIEVLKLPALQLQRGEDSQGYDQLNMCIDCPASRVWTLAQLPVELVPSKAAETLLPGQLFRVYMSG